MNKIWKGNSVFSLRKRPEEGDAKGSKYAGGGCRKVLKRFTVQLVATVLIVSTIGLGSLWFSQEPETESFDLDELLDSLDLPQMAPYLASSSVIPGNADGDELGYSVSSAGDFNNDEIDDIVVGSPFAEWGDRTLPGIVHIFLGGSGGDGNPLTADVTILGEADDSNFGHSVAGGGNIDGDDYDDVIVGCPDFNEENDPDDYKGKVYIFKGRTVTTHIYLYASSDAYFAMEGEGDDDYLGYSVAFAGHFNDDDYDDFIAGAPGYDTGHDEDDWVGRVYVILGDDTSPSTIAFDEDSAQTTAEFGKNISYAGNVDNDDYDDIIIGAPYWEDVSNDPVGRAYIFYGERIASDKDVSHHSVTELTGETSDDMFGHSVSFAGDIDNDGLADDVIVGAPGYDDGQESEAGRAYIFRGTISQGSSISASNAHVKLTGESTGANLGNAVSSAGNFNNDDYDDVIVGAYQEDTFGSGGTDAGKAHIFYGGSSMDNEVDITMVGDTSSTNRFMFGHSVSNAGDYDDDGFDDVIVGAPFADSQKGYAHVYNFHDHFSYAGNLISVEGERMGYSVASAGDFNGDNYDDVIIGSPYFGTDLNNAQKGEVYIFYGSSTGLSSTHDLWMTGGFSYDHFGWSVSSGDFNADNYDDVIVGAPHWDNGQDLDVGRAYIYFGGSSPDTTADVTITGESAGDELGWSVSTAGKWDAPRDNDNIDDILVGAPGYNSNQGRAYLFYGSSTLSGPISAGSANARFDAHDNDGEFGYSVSGLGDINNDEDDDLIIGAPEFDLVVSLNVGRSYVYFGDDGDPSTDDVKYTGETAGDEFGYSVSSAGNMNNDDYYDVIAGAPKYSSSKGRAYVFYGSSSPADTGAGSADVIMTGESAGDEFGHSVSYAGNIDNDNYDDVVVGGPLNDEGGTSAGRVYIYYGSSSVNAREDVVMTGQVVSSTGEQVGFAVANAGDINGDDYGDVITGAPYWSEGGSYRGRVKVWGDPS